MHEWRHSQVMDSTGVVAAARGRRQRANRRAL